MLEFSHIRFAYPDAVAYALDDVSLCVAPGEYVVLIGANGSGKSTLSKLANGMLLPSSGTVTADGMDTTDASTIRDLRTTVGVVAQNPESQIVSSTVTDEVAFGPENLGLPRAEIRKRVDAVIDSVGLVGKEDREPTTLSGGEKQRLVIAGILAMEPTYVVLDEPSSMLDGQGRAEVRAVIRKLHQDGRGILHITHDLTECIEADRIEVLDKGKLVLSCTPTELLADPDRIHAMGLSSSPMLELVAKLQEGGVKVPPKTMNPKLIAHAVAGSSDGQRKAGDAR